MNEKDQGKKECSDMCVATKIHKANKYKEQWGIDNEKETSGKTGSIPILSITIVPSQADHSKQKS